MADHKSWELGGNLELNLHKTIPKSEYRKVPSGQPISELEKSQWRQVESKGKKKKFYKI